MTDLIKIGKHDFSGCLKKGFDMNIVILDKPIREVNGLYCLNDLHKVSGGEKRHAPNRWLRLEQTSELIKELELNFTTQKWVVKQNQQVIKTINGGNNRGTFACRELVLAYATWISPAFFLTVLRTFDAVASGHSKTQLLPLDALGHLNQLPKPPRDLHEAQVLFADIDQLEHKVCMAYRDVLVARCQINHLLRQTQPWRDYWQMVETAA